jgi:hypothetical protein
LDRDRSARDAGFDQLDDARNRGLGIVSLDKIEVALGFRSAKITLDLAASIRVREAIREEMAEMGITREDIEDLMRKQKRPTRLQ